jgi:hypothetical protein
MAKLVSSRVFPSRPKIVGATVDDIRDLRVAGRLAAIRRVQLGQIAELRGRKTNRKRRRSHR